jgi:hypothetical protein
MVDRGIRNNNPGNLDLGIEWDGLAPVQTDPRFCVFITPEYGIRALIIVLLNYQTKYGLRTIRSMITRWAPPNENDTEAYIKFVAGRVGVSPDTVIDLHDVHLCKPMVMAIIAQENSNFAYQDSVLTGALALAGLAQAAPVSPTPSIPAAAPVVPAPTVPPVSAAEETIPGPIPIPIEGASDAPGSQES